MAGSSNHRGGMVDSALVQRDGASNLTADELAQAFTLHTGNPIQKPMALYVRVPQASASDTLKVTVDCISTGELIEVTHGDVIDDNTTFPFLLVLPLPPSLGTSWTYDLDVTGSGINFGGVEVWIGLVDNAKVNA